MKPGLPTPPLTWFPQGGGYVLLEAHGHRRVVIAAAADELVVRDGDGALVPLMPHHPVALLLRCAPDLYAACREFLDVVDSGQRLRELIAALRTQWSDDRVLQVVHAIEEARTAVARVEGAGV